MKIRSILLYCLVNNMLKYPIYFSLIIFLISSNLICSNQITVIDAKTGNSISEVNIKMVSLNPEDKDSTLIVRTDMSGKFSNIFGDAYIVLKYIGYKTSADTINSKTRTVSMEESSIFTDEVVVTGQIKPKSVQKSVYNIKVINKDRIKYQGANDLRELLLTEANMNISQDNILGSSININGISGQNVKIMVDGVPVIGRLNGNIDLTQINLNNIERVEIVQGPMSSIYGSDALGGVINLISKEAKEEQFELEAGTYLESVGTYNFMLNSIKSFDKFGIKFNGGRNLFQGFDSNNDSRRNIQWNPKEQYFADLQFSYNIEDHNLRFSSNYFNELILNRGNLRPPYFETAFDDKFRTNRFNNALFYNGKVSEDKFINFTTAFSFFQRNKNTYFKDMVTLEEQITESDADQDTSIFYNYMIRAVFSDDKLTNNLKYQSGVDFNYDVALGQRIENESQNMTDLAGFVSMEYTPMNALTIQPSLRVIYNSKFEAPVVPAVNLKYNFSNNSILRLSYAKGFRSPSIKELYFEFVDVNHNILSNPNLEAERSDSYQASYMYRFFLTDHVLSIESQLFYNNISNQIALGTEENQEDVFRNFNIDNFESIGGNLSINYFTPLYSFKLIATYIGRQNALHENTNTRRFNFAPEVSINTDIQLSLLDYIDFADLIDFSHVDAKINIFYKYNGERPGFNMVNNTPQEFFIDDFHIMDLSISKSFFDVIELVVGSKNIFNVVNINSTMAITGGAHSAGSSFPVSWGRTFFTRINFKVK